MRIVLPACAIIAAIAIICAPATAEPVKIRAGWIQPVSNIVSILFLKKGIARHYGQTYIVEPLRFAGTAPMVTGMAIDEVDVGVLGAAFHLVEVARILDGLESARCFHGSSIPPVQITNKDSGQPRC